MMKQPVDCRLLPLQLGFICALAAFLLVLLISFLNLVSFQVIMIRIVCSITAAFVLGAVLGVFAMKIYQSLNDPPADLSEGELQTGSIDETENTAAETYDEDSENPNITYAAQEENDI